MLSSSRRPRLLIVALGATALVLLTACGGTRLGETIREDNVFTVYFSTDLAGATGTLNRGLLGGVKAAVDTENAKGGINGQKIKLKVGNDESKPTTAVSNLHEALTSDNPPDLVYPGGTSAVTQSLLPITTRNKTLSIGATVSSELNDPEKFPYHFGVAEPTAAYVPPLIDELKQAGHKKIAMIYSNDATGLSAYAEYSKQIRGAGLDFTAVSYAPSALTMSPQLQQLQDQQPDALVFSGYGTAVLYVMRSRAQMNWNIPSYSDQTASAFPLTQQLDAKALENVHVIQADWTLRQPQTDPNMQELIDTAHTLPERDVMQKVGMRLFAVAHDTVSLAVYAARETGSTDGPTIAKFLETMDMTGKKLPWVVNADGASTFTYTPDDHFPNTPPESFSYISPGGFDADGLYVPGGGNQ